MARTTSIVVSILIIAVIIGISLGAYYFLYVRDLTTDTVTATPYVWDVVLSWKVAPSSLIHYHVYQVQAGGQKIALGTVTISPFRIESLTPGTTYIFGVQAFNTISNHLGNARETTVTTYDALDAPTHLDDTINTSGDDIMTWDAVSNSSNLPNMGYQVWYQNYIDTVSFAPSGPAVLFKSTLEPTCDITDFQDTTKYPSLWYLYVVATSNSITVSEASDVYQSSNFPHGGGVITGEPIQGHPTPV